MPPVDEIAPIPTSTGAPAPATRPAGVRRPATIWVASTLLLLLSPAVVVAAWTGFALDHSSNWFLAGVVSVFPAYVLFRCWNAVFYGYRNGWQSTCVIAAVATGIAAARLGHPTPLTVAATAVPALILLLLLVPASHRWCSKPAKGLKERLRDAQTGRR